MSMQTPSSASPQSIISAPSFQWVTSQYIPSLNLEIQQFEHTETGALHYHLASESEENVFLVGLRTVPQDSTGVAHILEHTALCGSKKYPVRDPFFMMLRRSLNTFMNAFTSSDWTAYPFASQNRKDFYNLLDVYLDAVFFSRLDALDFAQEGHRVEFSEPDNAASDLAFKGVVFNEMKGAMSSATSTLWQTLTRHLYPTTTYHFNSGGEPADIPDLTYEELLEFYRTHYHPSNAIFMTYGNIPAEELQLKIHEQALRHFQRSEAHIAVADEKRYFSPLHIRDAYASDESPEKHSHHVIGWLLGRSTNLQEQLEAHLLSNVLLQDSSSPLRHALEASALGASPSPLCGLEDSNREMCFVCGLEGSAEHAAQDVAGLVFESLEKVAEQGVDQQQLEAVLHQLELSQREVRGDGFPYGLQLILAGLPTAVHRGDPIAILNLDPVLETLRASIKDPDYIKGLVKRLLLDNPHRVHLTLAPDGKLELHRQQAERDRLTAIKQSMSPAQTAEVIELAEALKRRQEQRDDESILPKVGIADVPNTMDIPQGRPLQSSLAAPIDFFSAGTNGLLYQEVIATLPHLSRADLKLLPIYCACLTELGCGEKSYLEMQAWQSAVSGGIGASRQVRGSVDDEQLTQGFMTLSGKALARNLDSLAELMQVTFNDVRFDEHARIAELVAQMRSRSEQSITGRGHALAMTAAASRLSPSAQLAHQLGGLEGIVALKELDSAILGSSSELSRLAGQLSALHDKIKSAPLKFLVIGENDTDNAARLALEKQWSGLSAMPGDFHELQLPRIRDQVSQVWTTNTQVNFCARVFPTVPTNHVDSAPLTVLGEYLKNGYLHRAIREQGGAYGSFAGQDGDSASFRFASYRDPRLADTLSDFDAAVDWLLNSNHEARQLEEAILGIIGSMDKPGSPAGEAKRAFHGALFGRTAEQRRELRERILAVGEADLQRVGEQYLRQSDYSTAVVTSKELLGGWEEGAHYERFDL